MPSATRKTPSPFLGRGSGDDRRSSEILEWVRVYLEQDEDIIVPIKKMWNEWYATHMAPSLSEFTQIVLSDDRVEKVRGVDHIGHTDEMSPEEREEYERDMEACGFYSGPRVKLKSRQITKEHVARMLKKHNDRMEQALQEARTMIPEDATEADEGNLIDAIMLARKLRRDLRAAGLEPPEDEYSRRPSG